MTTDPTPSDRDREIAQATLEKINRLSMLRSDRIIDAIAAALAQAREEGEANGREDSALIVERWSLPTIQTPSMWLIDKAGIAAAIRSRKDD